MSGRNAPSAWIVLCGAGALGAVAGAASLAGTPEGRAGAWAAADRIAVAAGLARRRAPQAGDHWSGCDEARAAGTAPIHVGEPGYRPGMDGDGDGIACEPYRGR
jgi:hypothetical protein